MFFQSIDHFQGNPRISIFMLVYCRVTVVISDCGWSHCFKSTPWRSETIFQMVFGKDYFIPHRIHVCYIYILYIYGNIYHQYTPNVSIYTIHGSYGYWFHPFLVFHCLSCLDTKKWFKPSPLLRPPQAVERKKKEKDSEMGRSELRVGRIPCP